MNNRWECELKASYMKYVPGIGYEQTSIVVHGFGDTKDEAGADAVKALHMAVGKDKVVGMGRPVYYSRETGWVY